jgi:hypothetical protein
VRERVSLFAEHSVGNNLVVLHTKLQDCTVSAIMWANTMPFCPGAVVLKPSGVHCVRVCGLQEQSST